MREAVECQKLRGASPRGMMLRSRFSRRAESRCPLNKVKVRNFERDVGRYPVQKSRRIKARTNGCDVEYVRYATRCEWWDAILWQSKESENTQYHLTRFWIHTIKYILYNTGWTFPCNHISKKQALRYFHRSYNKCEDIMTNKLLIQYRLFFGSCDFILPTFRWYV